MNVGGHDVDGADYPSHGAVIGNRRLIGVVSFLRHDSCVARILCPSSLGEVHGGG